MISTPSIKFYPYATMVYAKKQNIPLHMEYSHYVSGSEQKLLSETRKYLAEHPTDIGYLCWTPEFGIGYATIAGDNKSIVILNAA